MIRMLKEVMTTLTPLEASILLFLQLSAVLVYVYQKKEGRLGGPISGIKAMWLVYAITSWFGIPFLMLSASRVFQWLLISMVVRGLIEVYLCWHKRWKTSYGLMHNGVQILLILAGLLFAGLGAEYQFWLWLLLIGFVTEVIFVLGFRKKHFDPSEGVYFVPSGEAGRSLNYLTWLLFAPQYVLWLVLLVCSASK